MLMWVATAFTIAKSWDLLRRGMALAAILIVVVGVVAGVFTATESAAIAVIYSLLVSLYVYKGLTWKGVWKKILIPVAIYVLFAQIFYMFITNK